MTLFCAINALLPLLLRLGVGEKTRYVPVALLVVFSASLALWFKGQSRIYFAQYAASALHRMRRRLYWRTLFSHKQECQSALNLLSSDLSNYEEWLRQGSSAFVAYVCTLGFGGSALFIIEPHMAAMALLPMLILPAFMFLVSHWNETLSQRVQERRDKVSQALKELLPQVQTMYAQGREEEGALYLKKAEKKLFRAKLVKGVFEGSFFPFLTLSTKMMTLFLLIYQGMVTWQWQEKLPAMDLFIFMWLQSMLFSPLVLLARGWLQLRRAQASFQRMQQVLQGEYALSFPVATVEASPSFFTGSVRENLFLPDQGLTDLAKQELSKLHLHIDSYLPAAGKHLSLGEKKRLAWVRMLAQDQKTWCLRKPFAGLDTTSSIRLERLCFQHLEAKGKLMFEREV